MLFLYGLISWHKQNLVLTKPLKGVDILLCRIKGDRIYLAGKAALYGRGEIYIMD